MEYVMSDFYKEVLDYSFVFLKCGLALFMSLFTFAVVVFGIRQSRLILNSDKRIRDIFLILVPQMRTYIAFLFINAFVGVVLSDEIVIYRVIKESVSIITVSPVGLVVVMLCAVGFVTPIKCIISVFLNSDYKAQTIVFLEWVISIVFAVFCSALASFLVEWMTDLELLEDFHKATIYGLCCIGLFFDSRHEFLSKLSVRNEKKHGTQVLPVEEIERSEVC